MKKIVFRGLIVGLVAVAALAFLFQDRIQRVRMVASLFSGAEQYEFFCRTTDLFDYSVVPPSDTPFDFPVGETIELPASFRYQDKPVNTESFLADTDTAALLVLNDGRVRYEQYMLTGGREVTWLSMSVAKSFVSALVGIAVADGHIASIEDPITKYVPKLAGSAYDGVRIKDILQMSSGARWDEDYSDSNSDINRFSRIFALGGSLDDFTASLQRENEPGKINHYNSMDTQALGMLLVAATNRSITDYMAEKLWQPLGAESAGQWLLDSNSMEMAFGGFNATARDYAKLGELYRLHGNWNGTQIVPAEWVKASVTADSPHLVPGRDFDGKPVPWGYGYQWWIPISDEGEFTAIGVYNQFVYVNPTRNIVIVKLSANSEYGTSTDESSYRELETIEFFRAVIENVGEPSPTEESEDAEDEVGV